MKATIFLAVGALCIIRAETGKLESEFAGVPSVYNLMSVSVGSRHKRQMEGRPGGGMCSDEEQTRRLTAVVCTPATGQRIIDVNLECNLESVARALVQSCSTNENQRFCYESASNYTNSVVANCPRLSTYVFWVPVHRFMQKCTSKLEIICWMLPQYQVLSHLSNLQEFPWCWSVVNMQRYSPWFMH